MIRNSEVMWQKINDLLDKSAEAFLRPAGRVLTQTLSENVKQKDIGNNLNHLFWTESLNTKTFGVDLTVRNHRKYLQMCYLQEVMGC